VIDNTELERAFPVVRKGKSPRAAEDASDETDGGSSKPNKQQLRSSRSTHALLEAAAELIGEGGLDALTFAAIGERAGYSRGLVTARFGSKAGLIDALIDRIVTQWSQKSVFPQTRGRDGLDGAMLLMDAIGERAAAESHSLRVLYVLMFEAIGPDDELKRRFAKFHEEFRASFEHYIVKGLGDGSISESVDPVAEAAVIVGALRGLGYQWLLDAENFDLAHAFEYLSKTTRARLQA